MHPDAAALKTCCLDALGAKNGHGRRWAVDRCVRALRRPGEGCASVIDEQAARAMVAVAQAIACVLTVQSDNKG